MRSGFSLPAARRCALVSLGLTIGLAIGSGASCAGPRLSTREISIARGVSIDLFEPRSLGQSISLEQIVEARHGERRSTIHCLLEVNERELVLVGLTPFGTRAFVLTLSDGELSLENSTGQPLPAEPSRILADLQLALWPTLPPMDGLEVSERAIGGGGHVREFRRTGTGSARGAVVIRVTYEDSVPWQGRLRLEHVEQDYVLDVRTLRAESLSP